MEKLNIIWHYQFDGLKTLDTTNYRKLENIFLSYIHGSFGNLETLMVRECNSVQEIFQLSVKLRSVENTTQLKKVTLLQLLKLKEIWSRDPQRTLCFQNL